jgi:hypothetical protein
MNGVIAMTDLLMQAELAPDQRDFVDTIRTSGESLLTIIDDILNFSKLESKKMELEQRPMDLRQCVEETLDLLASRAAEKNLDLVLQIDPEAPTAVVGDSTRLRQILVNLVNNAIKFTNTGAVSVHIVAGQSSAASTQTLEPREFNVVVRDTGIGISTETMGRLFRSFSQADSSITRQYGGTGLGLAISKGLVELMGGRMWVESTEGVGSAFHFALALPQSGVEALRPVTPLSPVLAGQRVLIVEDGPVSRRALAELVAHGAGGSSECRAGAGGSGEASGGRPRVGRLPVAGTKRPGPCRRPEKAPQSSLAPDSIAQFGGDAAQCE